MLYIKDLSRSSFVCRYSLFQAAQTITPNIIMFLPRNVDINQAAELSWLSSPPLDVEVLFLLFNTSFSAKLLLLIYQYSYCFIIYLVLWRSYQLTKDSTTYIYPSLAYLRYLDVHRLKRITWKATQRVLLCILVVLLHSSKILTPK